MILPFKPGGPGVLLAATPGGGIAVQPRGPLGGEVCYLVFNAVGGEDVWLGYGMTSGAAVTNAALPLLGGESPALPCPSGSLQVFTLAPQLYFSARTQMGSASLSVTPGYGN